MMNVDYAKFSTNVNDFAEHDSISDRATIDTKLRWVVHGSSQPHFNLWLSSYWATFFLFSL